MVAARIQGQSGSGAAVRPGPVAGGVGGTASAVIVVQSLTQSDACSAVDSRPTGSKLITSLAPGPSTCAPAGRCSRSLPDLGSRAVCRDYLERVRLNSAIIEAERPGVEITDGVLFYLLRTRRNLEREPR